MHSYVLIIYQFRAIVCNLSGSKSHPFLILFHFI